MARLWTPREEKRPQHNHQFQGGGVKLSFSRRRKHLSGRLLLYAAEATDERTNEQPDKQFDSIIA